MSTCFQVRARFWDGGEKAGERRRLEHGNSCSMAYWKDWGDRGLPCVFLLPGKNGAGEGSVMQKDKEE